MKTVKSLEYSDLLIKNVIKATENEIESGFLGLIIRYIRYKFIRKYFSMQKCNQNSRKKNYSWTGISMQLTNFEI